MSPPNEGYQLGGNGTGGILARAAERVRQLQFALAAEQELIKGLQQAVAGGDQASALAALAAELGPPQVRLQRQLEAAQSSITEVMDLVQERAVARGQPEVYISIQEAKQDARPLLKDGVMPAPNPATWQQRKFQRIGSYGLWQFSAYRAGPDKVAMVCLSVLRLHDLRHYDGCTWFSSDGGTIQGTLSMLYMDEHHSLQYEDMVMTCKLESAMGAEGGHLVASIEREEVVMYREDPKAVAPAGPAPSLGVQSPPYTSKLTVCTPRLYGDLDEERVWEWFEYHRVTAGADRFILYDIDALGPQALHRLGAYLQAGMVEITDFRDARTFNIWQKAQGVSINDCIYRTRESAMWIALMDVDEYLEVVPPHTLGSLLLRHSSAAWLTHGVVWWGIERCVPLPGDAGAFAVERTRYRWPHTYCLGNHNFTDVNYCLEYHGHRKYILNPRKVHLARIHSLTAFDGEGVDMNVESEMRHHHFQDVVLRGNKKLCNLTAPYDGERPEGWWIYDDRVAEMVKRVRACPVSDRTCVAQLPD